MKKIKGFLIYPSYGIHRAVVLLFITIAMNFLDGSGFDVPVIWRRIINVMTGVVMLHIFSPLILEAIPMIYMLIRTGFKLPNKETYTNKGDYILPFTGKWTVSNGGFTKEQFHQGFSERLAYDFAIFEDEDEGDIDDWTLPTKVEEYPCYGKDIVAVADGVVVKVSNHHPDSRTNGQKAYCDTWEQRGNHIVIEHNDSEYSLTAHLMPKSVTVKVGDKVKQGEVIAKCGNSGTSTAPHIHFQLQSSSSSLLAVSLPIAFTNIKAQDSAAYREFCEAISRTPPKVGENIEVVGNKTYIGRGLDVENIID